jgi:hypothetical protein
MKTKYISFIAALLLILPLKSCYIHDDRDIVNDAEGNFDMLWKICDEYYCYFDYKGIDWNSVYEKYKPLVNNGMSDEELAKAISDNVYTGACNDFDIRYDGKCCGNCEKCDAVIKWLKQPAE